ncbi:MAG: hypothetical protein KC468_00495 [Myxococcales bacterium]|nr:hypothetical protein [Myxococcales bacterium]
MTALLLASFGWSGDARTEAARGPEFAAPRLESGASEDARAALADNTDEERAAADAVEDVDEDASDEREDAGEDEAAEDVDAEPATRAAGKILALKDKIYENLRETRYQHRTYVRRRQGVYRWDCSAMVAWFLQRVAPVAHAAVDRPRPVARDYYRVIKRSSTRRWRDGWRRLEHIEDARPGDLFAWIRPPDFPSRNTGHVGFVLEPARRYPALPNAYTVRILDATSLPHGDDTRARDGEGGIGEGTLLFLTDGEGRGTAYGWFGADSRGVIATDIVFGRVRR